jgi:quercetin dioxygenase-like cupin family protein/DNA-binding XRE family transcriptional regulator
MKNQSPPKVGLRLRALRHQRGLSQRALADLCDLSANAISLIERGINSPSVSTLHQLSTALGVHITELFAAPDEEVKLILTRTDDRVVSGSSSVKMESLGYGLRDQACDPFAVTLKPGASSGEHLMVHDGHELVYCLEGELEYQVAGESYRLHAGDALLFHADQPHRWRNPNAHPVTFLLVMQLTEDRSESVDQHLHP